MIKIWFIFILSFSIGCIPMGTPGPQGDPGPAGPAPAGPKGARGPKGRRWKERFKRITYSNREFFKIKR